MEMLPLMLKTFNTQYQRNRAFFFTIVPCHLAILLYQEQGSMAIVCEGTANEPGWVLESRIAYHVLTDCV